MTEPLVSVLMPIRRWGLFTVAAMNSVLAQTWRNLELLVVCDAVTDPEAALEVSARLPEDARIRCIERPAGGIVAALNAGLAQARGEFVARMDADDVAHRSRLAAQYAFLQRHPHIDLAAGRVNIVSSNSALGEGHRRYQYWLNAATEPAAIAAQLYRECPVPHPTWFAPRHIFERLGGWRERPWPEDYDLVLRSAQAGMLWGKPDAVLLDGRDHEGRLTHTDSRYSRWNFTRAKADALVHPQHPLALAGGRGVWLCGTGRNARDWFDALAERNLTVAGFVDLDRNGRKQRKRERPVITYRTLPERRGSDLLIATVSNARARTALLALFEQLRLVVDRDFIIGN